MKEMIDQSTQTDSMPERVTQSTQTTSPLKLSPTLRRLRDNELPQIDGVVIKKKNTL